MAESRFRSRLRGTSSMRQARPAGGHLRQLLVIDNAPLKRVAWTEFKAARKRFEKVAAQLNRHEQNDLPAYEKWLRQTFPGLIATLRQLHEEVFAKEIQVQHVHDLVFFTGRSAKKIWRELKREELNPQPSKAEDRFREEFENLDWDEDFSDLSGENDKLPKQEKTAGDHRRGDLFIPASAEKSEMKAVYRRLVQQLHPDTGGEWSEARARLWHEVQRAWADRDGDWLARLEVEWESASEMLTAKSPLSRLRAAILQLRQARRDTERKLRNYRGSLAWDFTLREEARPALHRQTEANFRHDLDFLQRRLVDLNTTIAGWEKPQGMARANASDEPSYRRSPRKRGARRSTGWDGT